MLLPWLRLQNGPEVIYRLEGFGSNLVGDPANHSGDPGKGIL
jgi:hypothetical protein